MKLLALVLLLILGPFSSAPSHATGRADDVVCVRIENQLDLGTLAVVQRAIRAAAATESGQLVVEIDTPGGQIDLMWQIAKALDGATRDGITVTAWVNDQALSAGVLLAISCERIYATALSSIGSAQPIRVAPTGMEAVPEKVASVFRAQVRAWAQEHGRSPAIAMAMVDAQIEVRRVWVEGEERYVTGTEWDDFVDRDQRVELISTVARAGELLNFTGPEAVEHGYADGLAESLDEVLDKIGFAGARVERIERARSEELLGLLNRYSLILIALGLLFAFAEIKAPGFGLPGILSIVCFAVLFTGRYLVGLADIPHIVLAVIGVTAIAVELFVLPGTLWVGLAGGACLLAALVFGGLGQSFSFANPLDRQLMLTNSFKLVLAAAASSVALLALARFLPRAPVVGRLVLTADEPVPVGSALPGGLPQPGARGLALTALRPVGKVRLVGDGQTEFEARAAGPAIDSGQDVIVIEVASGRLVVEPLALRGDAS